MKTLRSEVTRWLYPAVILTVVFLLWEVLGRAGQRTVTSTPLPTEVFTSLAHNPGFYLHHTAVTIGEALGGLVVATVAALLAASLFALSNTARSAFMPIVIGSQTIPLVAVAPLLSPLLGDGFISMIVVAAWLCWFPAVVSATHGLLNVDRRHLALFQSYGASRLDIFWKLRAPNAAPSLVAGVRAAAGFALIGAIVVEYTNAKEGLGAFIMAQTIHRTDSVKLFGVVVVAAIAGLALTEGAYALTRWSLRRYLPPTP